MWYAIGATILVVALVIVAARRGWYPGKAGSRRRRYRRVMAKRHPKERGGFDPRPVVNTAAFLVLVAVISLAILGLEWLLPRDSLFIDIFLWVLGFALLVLVAGAILKQGLVFLENDPPTVSLLTFFGKILKVKLGEGWHFLLFRKFIFGVVTDFAHKQDVDDTVKVYLPNGAPMEISYSLTLQAPDKPEHLRTWFFSGGFNGVVNLLKNILRQRIRSWANSGVMGPQNHREALRSDKEATKIMLDRLRRDQEKVDKNTFIYLPYGAKIIRLNTEQIIPLGKLADAIAKTAEEEEERLAERVEMHHLRRQVYATMRGLSLSGEQALEAFQTERGKVEKKIEEKKYSISKAAAKALPKLKPINIVINGGSGSSS